MGAVWCGDGVAMLCWASEGERGRVWLGSELGTHGVHGVAVERDLSLASRQGARDDGSVSGGLRGDRRASGTSHTCWGAVMEKSGVGVHARPELGELRHGGWRTAPQGVRAWSPPF